MKKHLGLATTLYETIALSFVIPSEAEGSAVPRTFPGETCGLLSKTGPVVTLRGKGIQYVDGKPETARFVYRLLPHPTHTPERAPRRHPT
jgi:hypothetical protein